MVIKDPAKLKVLYLNVWKIYMNADDDIRLIRKLWQKYRKELGQPGYHSSVKSDGVCGPEWVVSHHGMSVSGPYKE